MEPTGRIAKLVYAMVLAGCCVGLAISTMTSPRRLLYDEPWYLETVRLIDTHGLSREFLLALPGPAGPLYTLVHWLARPATALEPPAVRLVNLGCLSLTVIGLGASIRRLGLGGGWWRGAEVTATPMVLVCSGLALTEMPAIAIFCLHFPLIVWLIQRPWASPPARGAAGVAAGLLIGVAACGRQNLFMAVPAGLALVLAGGRAYALPVGAIIAAGAALPGLLYVVWGGPVPPQTSYVSGFNPWHGLLAYAYGGMAYVLFDPGWLTSSRYRLAGCLACGVAGNAAFGFVSIVPMRTTVERALGVPSAIVWGQITSGLLLGVGLAFAAYLAELMIRSRRDPLRLYLATFVSLTLATNAQVAHLFSSRYVVVAVPALCLLAASGGGGQPLGGWPKVAALAAGGVVGLSSLRSYYLWHS